MSRSPAFLAQGFDRFLDRLMLHGLEFLNLYYGEYRAQVIENIDDQDQGRIKIRCPAVGDTNETPPRLAYPKAPLAGSDYGVKFIPPAGGHCYVTFENGRVSIPLWYGGWWGRDDIPDNLKDVDQHWIRTPGNHLILLDDRENNETIQFRHKNGAEIVLDKDGNISITNTSGKLVTVGVGSNEPGMLGDTWKQLFEETLDAILVMTHPTAVGPSGVPINSTQFQAVKSRLQTALSTTVKIAK